MPRIITGHIGTRGDDLINVVNPDAHIQTINGVPTLLVWGGAGDDHLTFKVGWDNPNVEVRWLYGDVPLGNPDLRALGNMIGFAQGDDVLHGSGGWRLTGGGGADVFFAHGGHYRDWMSIRDFDPAEGDRIMASGDDWTLKSFDFKGPVYKDGPHGLKSAVRNVRLTLDDNSPVTDGQRIEILTHDAGDGHTPIMLEWGGRGEPETRAEAIHQWIEDGIGDWLIL